MDNFWDAVEAGLSELDASTCRDALYEDMVTAGVVHGDAGQLATASVDQAMHHGYFTGGNKPEIPGRTVKKGVPCK